ncbi:MAG: hypothetical protein HQK58_11320 [Deltaproteobacteria bacterium]|nr:hypothetical protein [Deltaproteobacteria bacterium]
MNQLSLGLDIPIRPPLYMGRSRGGARSSSRPESSGLARLAQRQLRFKLTPGQDQSKPSEDGGVGGEDGPDTDDESLHKERADHARSAQFTTKIQQEIQIMTKTLTDSIPGDNVKSTINPVNLMPEFPSIEDIRLSQDFHQDIGVEKVLAMIPVRKPNRQEYVRVIPREDMVIQTYILERKEENETYLVAREFWPALSEEIKAVALYPTVNRNGILTLWPITLPGADGRWNPWHRSAANAVDLAKRRWIRLAASKSLGGYEVFTAAADLPEPIWPEISANEMLKIAFKDFFINSLDHPVIQQLHGRI